MLGRGNEIVITVDPVRKEAKQRQEEVSAAAKNDGSGLLEWIVEEAAWLVAQLTRVAMSVAVVRGVHQLFRGGFASESAYQRAPDLWSHGHQQQDRRGTSAHPSGSTGTWRPNAGGSAQSGSFDQRANHNDADSPRYVVTVEGFHLYLHRRLLSPGKQLWPCPLLYMAACEACSFLEYDGGGRPQCVPLVKLKMVLDGQDSGEDLAEIREWIRSS